jgi:hypothetical protein
MRCAFCQNGDISTDKNNGEEMDPRTPAAMACAAPGRLPQHQLGGRRGRHSPPCILTGK